MTITAIVQPTDAVRRSIAQSLNLSFATASLDDLLASHAGEFDAVLIRGSVTKRADLACQAARAGKHVFVTSPAATTELEVDRMAAACQTAGVALRIGSRRRFEPAMTTVKSALESGKLGSPALLRMHHWLPRETGRPDAWSSMTQRQPGPMWSEIVNLFDLALWMFGREPTEIFVQGRPSISPAEHWPGYLQIHLGFSDGGMALISLAWDLPVGPGYDVLSIIGSTGAAYADAHHQMQLKFRGDAPRSVVGNDDIPAKVAQLREFVAAVTDPKRGVASVHEMKTALRLTDAAWESLVRRQPVAFAGEHHAAIH